MIPGHARHSLRIEMLKEVQMKELAVGLRMDVHSYRKRK
jgi:hypothetical protein